MNAFKTPEMNCSVFGCYSRLSVKTFDRIKLHPYPQKGATVEGKDLLMTWIRSVKLTKKYTKRMRVCSLHFADEDFEVVDGKKTLKKEAVPSKLLPSVWRNKFFPRDYGQMIKQLEYRGIGRLRLCHEAKLVKRLSKASKRKPDPPPKKQDVETTKKAEDDKEKESDCVPIVSNTFSLSKESDTEKEKVLQEKSTENIENSMDEHNFTSEIMIKEEPISENEEAECDEMMQEEDRDIYGMGEPEETKDKEETVEEMLAKMNAEDSNTGMSDEKKLEVKNALNAINYDYDDTMDSGGTGDKFCSVCGDEECFCDEESFFPCVPCGKVFRTSRQLNAHNLSHFEYKTKKLSPEEQRAKDQMMKETTCKVCHKVLSTKMTLTEHMLIHSGEKPHVCMLCDKAFRHKANLVQHVNTHTLVRNYKCKMCRQYFCTTEELDKHVKKHRVVKKEYSCRECGQTFRSKSACWTHLNSHARGRSKSGLPCQVCGRVLSTKATLREHMFIHSGEKPFECLLCGKKIRHRANFIIHVQGHSLGQPHVCMTCGTSFPKKSELNSHIAAEHPNDSTFACIICGMRFKSEKRFHKHAVTHDATLDDA